MFSNPSRIAETLYRGMDVAGLWAIQAIRRANDPFLVWEPFDRPSRSWTYAEFDDDVRRVAAGIAARGLQRNDRILIHLENCPEWVMAWLACARLGVVAVTTNIRSSADELQYYAGHSGARAIVTQPNLVTIAESAAPHLDAIVVGSSGADSFEMLLRSEPLVGQEGSEPNRILSIQYTSGTTARPKGVVWTHANALWGGQVGVAHEGLRPDDVHLLTMPLFHTNALAYSLLPTIWAGSTVVIQPRFSASRFWDVAVRNRCTWAALVGFCLKALKQHEVPYDHSFRMWGCAFSEPRSDQRYGVKTIGWWGMTETITHGIVGSVDLPNRPMSIGRAAPEYTLQIRRSDGVMTESGEVGHLFIKGIQGLSLFAGYLDDPEATQAAFDSDGWLDTGDLVRQGDDGFIDFVDRAKDMLKVGGENVAASEIERVVRGVVGVSDTAVVGRRHPMLDEVPVAFVVLEPGSNEKDVREAIAAQVSSLADFKRPRDVIFVGAIPESTLGKAAKGELRELAARQESERVGE
ncbi:MAG: crotonobetaine/carnitine-CoA ligase [Minisyncoccia bacterium]|jgi:crotonobetaine/carnitine-CoA ligase